MSSLPLRSSFSTLTSRLRRLPPPWLFIVARQMVDRLGQGLAGLEVLLRQKALPVLNDMGRHPVEVSRGLGNPSEGRKGVAEEGARPGHPQDNQRANGRSCFFACICLLLARLSCRAIKT
jgi:hypothetical protein